ncbi:hypothetical protein DPMN_071578 [Dreissena polymorpha]|uniref:Uncharacterized protein n=1 Tax=Dreissena polymorpha TaxID=45954 RepID=A0A9D4BWD9_DREPO|nr:hypothetical protein DPMN_071578 [Dreissena polymorpha]
MMQMTFLPLLHPPTPERMHSRAPPDPRNSSPGTEPPNAYARRTIPTKYMPCE